MDTVIFSDFGVEIFRRGGRFFLRYDSGELVVNMEEIEISEEESFKAQRSEQDAYEVILSHQK